MNVPFKFSGRSRRLASFGLATFLLFGSSIADAQQRVSQGATRGELRRGDAQLSSGEFVDSYTLQVRAGETYVFTAESTQFDTWLIVNGAGASDVQDDDSGGNLNARIQHTFSQNGSVQVAVTSAAPGESGTYTLNIQRVSQQTGIQPSGGGIAQQAAPPAQGASLTASTLAPGRTVNGTLVNGDETLSSGEFVDTYSFNGVAGQRVRIRMNSNQFDAYLMLRGPETSVDNDDAPSGGQNAEIDTRLVQTGTYSVMATSYEPGESGAYTISLENVGSPAASVAPQRINFGQTVQGRLEGGDFQRQNGQYYDRFTFQGRRGQLVQLDLTSSDFDTYLVLRSPDGGGEENDDIDDSNRNSRVVFTLPADGSYEVHATSYARNESGAYSLRLTEVNRNQPSAAASARSRSLTVGSASSDTLRESDPRLEAGEHYHVWEFNAAANQTYSVSMTSSSVDTWVVVRQGDNTLLSNDDEAAGSTNAGGTFTVPTAGPVRVIATSYGPSETGPYSLLVRTSTGAATPTTPSGTGTAGRVFVISVGISDYQGTNNDLQYCAEDATKIRDAVREARALAPESIVLTDRQATRANLTNAFRRAAQTVGPDDVLLFFFSGHGGQERTQDANEFDGFDETLVLYDGTMTDNELGSLMDSVNARLQIAAIDACHAGGFARDLITRSNRLGVFSSEEDVLSLVASRFRAGGYLAHFLRGAIAGGADTDPRDGNITVGELTQSLRREWATHMTNVRTETGSSEGTYQNLVIERGAKVSDVLIGNRQSTR